MTQIDKSHNTLTDRTNNKRLFHRSKIVEKLPSLRHEILIAYLSCSMLSIKLLVRALIQGDEQLQNPRDQ